MNSRTHFRLLVLYGMVATMLLVLLGRLWTMQVMDSDHYRELASQNRVRNIVVPAVRGAILDSSGKALVRNRSALVVSVDSTTLRRQPDGGDAVLNRLAAVLGTTRDVLEKRTRLCTAGVSRPCWAGSPYQPIPVAEEVDPRKAIQIMERREDFPGVIAQVQPVREYPGPSGATATQTLGYLQPVTQEELDKREGLKVTGYSGVDLIGRDGLEAQYDKVLRGDPGLRQVLVDSQGRITSTASEQPPVPGSTLVTSIDAEVQGAAEQALKNAMKSARKAGHKAPAASAVVMDVTNGRLIALASFPTYDPTVWTGGISQADYEALLGPKRGEPLISRATEGMYAPGSTFKVSSVSAAVMQGYPFKRKYSCPGSYQLGNRSITNYHSVSHGMIDLHRALVVSCDTIFYRFAHQMWNKDGGDNAKPGTVHPMIAMAKGYGFGRETGIDLPNESSGRIPGREWKRDFWNATRETNCKRGKEGYPEIAKKDPSRAAYLKKLAGEQCKIGWKLQAGDMVNFAIGQGDVLVTPLQLTRAYAAIANGGTLVTPTIGKAVLRPDGSVARMIQPPEGPRVPVDGKYLKLIRNALAEVPENGTAAGAFAGFPLDKVPVAGKTGTAEVWGKEDTSVFASYAPANDPRFAVVVIVPQAGTGSSTAAPAVREIYESIYGLAGKKPALENGLPPTELPKPGQAQAAP